MSMIAIIPARSGSKGLKDKNIKPLCGKPMIAYTIEAAINTGLFDEVFVSTDSQEYADISVKYGASVPFLRDPELATSGARTWDVILNAIDIYDKKLGKKYDSMALLQPTSPLRDSDDILDAYKMFIEKDAVSVISVSEVEHSPLRSNTLPKNLSLGRFFSNNIHTVPRQELPTYYCINGAIYFVKMEKLLESLSNLYSARSYAYIMSKEKSIDIDDERDFLLAQIIMEKRLQKSVG